MMKMELGSGSLRHYYAVILISLVVCTISAGIAYVVLLIILKRKRAQREAQYVAQLRDAEGNGVVIGVPANIAARQNEKRRRKRLRELEAAQQQQRNTDNNNNETSFENNNNNHHIHHSNENTNSSSSRAPFDDNNNNTHHIGNTYYYHHVPDRLDELWAADGVELDGASISTSSQRSNSHHQDLDGTDGAATSEPTMASNHLRVPSRLVYGRASYMPSPEPQRDTMNRGHDAAGGGDEGGGAVHSIIITDNNNNNNNNNTCSDSSELKVGY